MLTPVSGWGWNEELLVDGYVPKAPHDNVIWFNAVSDGFFSTLGTRVLLGRDFDVPAFECGALFNRFRQIEDAGFLLVVHHVDHPAIAAHL